MDEKEFNPFEDRMSRDLRNDLSAAFVASIATSDRTTLDQLVARYHARQLADCYHRYLSTRLRLYDRALSRLAHTGDDPVARSIVLWNLGLFFEVHELLEHAWYDARGVEKTVLQALIRAAGVYIKKEYGYHDAAARIAAKALPALDTHRELLTPYFDVEPLLAALATNNPEPPQLSI